MLFDTVRPRFLVIAGSGIGDILVATPVMRALRRAHPESHIDVLVPIGRGAVLDGNPDINGVVEVCRKRGVRAGITFLKRMWRRYDLVLSARAGDRSITNAWLAGRRRISNVRAGLGRRAWQRHLLHEAIAVDDQSHAVMQGLRLLDACGVPRCYELVPPECSPEARSALDTLFPQAHEPYAVLHLYPRNIYKCWTAEGWRTVIRHLAERGMPVILTGSNEQGEQRYLNTVLAQGVTPCVVNLIGRLSLPQVSALLSRASLYVGPDTGMTHLAAAHGIPTVALFGPTNPVYWGPWPVGYDRDASPFVQTGCQQVNNVFLVQHEGECIGCGQEGCEDDPRKPSRCMQELQEALVLATIDKAVGTKSRSVA